MPVDPKKKEVRHLKLKQVDEDLEVSEGTKLKNVGENLGVREALEYRNVNDVEKPKQKPLNLPPVAKTGAGKSPSEYEAERASNEDENDPKKNRIKGDDNARKHYSKERVNLKRLFGFE